MIVSAAEFRRNIGTYQDRALTEPVFVTRNGRERIVLLSVEEYQRLEQRDHEAQALEQQRQILSDLQNILNSSDVATLFLDDKLNIRFFTPSAKSLFGVIASDVGRPLGDLARRFDDSNLLSDARRVLADLAPLTRKVETEDGIWLTRRISPCRTPEGQVEGVVITFADISEMKVAERELQTIRTYYDGIIDAIRQPLVVLDEEFRVLSASRSFYATLAVKPEQTIGLPLAAPGGPLDSPHLRALLAQMAADDAAVSDREVAFDRPTGRHTFLVDAHRMPEDGDRKPKYVLTLNDVAEHRRVEEALEAAKRQTEQANASKMRILAAASHDLRQPLQTLNLLLGILAKKTKDEGALRLVGKLDETLVAMSGMLNTLLDINHLEAGTVRVEISSFPIGQLLEQLRTEFAYHAEVTGLGWSVVSCRLRVRSDPRLLEQILRNLLSNAVKYTQHGKVLLGCRRRGRQLRIEVWDTGIGITEEQLQLIAAKFRQSDPRHEYSVGLGLSVVQRLAGLLRHNVAVTSRLGRGSVFSVEVDLADDDAALQGWPDGQERLAAAGGDGPILVIEDDPAVREMLALTLTGEGYRTIAVADGTGINELVASKPVPPSLVIADHVLPNGRNGLQVVTAVQAILPHPIPAIILTGETSAAIIREITRHGCVPLSKPVKTSELLDQLQTLLAERRAPAPQPSARPPSSQPTDGRPTIHVIDDDPPLREAMRDLLEENGWGVELYVTAETFVESYGPDVKGCLLVDARLPGMGGLELLKWLRRQEHRVPAVMMTGYGDVSIAVEAMKAGAADFIEKPVHHDDLIAAVGRALEQTTDSAAVSARNAAATKSLARLTPREREVMNMVLAGHPSKNIAADLGISQRTVENHRASIMKKTGSRSLPALIRLALAAA
jgi:two-component system CheB/CheR fusion protein